MSLDVGYDQLETAEGKEERMWERHTLNSDFDSGVNVLHIIAKDYDHSRFRFHDEEMGSLNFSLNRNSPSIESIDLQRHC